jgi:Tfp pilus assembly PilM family ATPase/Tfp pilus assembly protein PilN
VKYSTLCISNSCIRILTVKGKRIYRWGSAALPEGLVRDGLITQPQAVADAINSLFKSLKIPREKVIVSISGLSFTYRFQNLPRIKPDSLDEAIRRGAKKDISIPLNELYLSWQFLTAHEEEQIYFILGVSRHLIDALAKTLETAGIEPYLMDIQPLALARAANHGSAIIVNLEPESYDIIIIADGIPMVIHTIIPRGKGAILEDNINRLADEISKATTFYQSNHPGNNLDDATSLLLTGELADNEDTKTLLQSMTKYRVEILNPAMEYPQDLPTNLYSTNIGLVLKKIPGKKADREEAVKFHDVNINLFEEKYRKAKPPRTTTAYIITSAVLAIAVILLYPLYQGKSQIIDDNSFLEDRQYRIDRELSLASFYSTEAEATKNTTLQLTATLQAIQGIQQDILGYRGNYIDEYLEIIRYLPKSLSITSMNINQDSIIVEGEAESVFTVVEYATRLENNGKFSEIRIVELDESVILQDDAEGGEIDQAYLILTIFKISISR